MTVCTKTNSDKDAFTKASVSLEIENIYNKCPETTYLDAIRIWVDEHDMDESEIKEFLSDALIQKLTTELTSVKLLKSAKSESYDLDSMFM